MLDNWKVSKEKKKKKGNMDEKEVKDNRNKLYYHIGKLVNIHIFIHYYNLNAIGEICIKELCM